SCHREGFLADSARQLTDQDDVILTGREPSTFDRSSEFLDDRAHGVETVLRVLDHPSPRLGRVCRLQHVVRHLVASPSFLGQHQERLDVGTRATRRRRTTNTRTYPRSIAL